MFASASTNSTTRRINSNYRTVANPSNSSSKTVLIELSGRGSVKSSVVGLKYVPESSNFKEFMHQTSKKIQSALGLNQQRCENEVDPGDGVVSQLHRPESLQELCEVTKFSRKELQHMYRGFKEACPSGSVTQEQLTIIYASFFPHKEVNLYTEYVFNSFDLKRNGYITFRDLVIGLSTLCRGTIEERLTWIFNLYDVNKDGLITRNDIELIVRSMYQIMGNTVPPINDQTIEDRICYIFQKMDKNGFGEISLGDFIHSCTNDDKLLQSLASFDNIV